MPKGGRRHAKTIAEHQLQGTVRKNRHAAGAGASAKRSRPPRPPADLPDVERDAWREVARQVQARGTYTPAHYSAFRLAVKALAAVYAAPVDLKATSMRGLIESASKMLGRFGLDPVATAQVGERQPSGKVKEDPAAAFLFGPRLVK